MGTPEGERDWVDVANDLLSKCHVSLKLRKLTDCDAHVFIALYENILGEQVPDFIAEPRSQEDDIHNIQSVIDSLSLDYLQISLSHITGENIVRSDKESLKNLLEIFDGLLEYLNEEINEESQDGEELTDSLNEAGHGETNDPRSCNAAEQKGAALDAPRESSNGGSTVQSRRHTLHPWAPEEARSTGELMGLGVSARTFTDKQEGGLSTSERLDAHDIPPTAPPLSNVDPHPPSRPPSLATQQTPAEEEADPPCTETSGPAAKTAVGNGVQSPPHRRSPAQSERSASSQQRADNAVEGKTLEPTNGGPRRVLFHTQPDVLFLTLQEEMAASSSSSLDTEEEEEGGEEVEEEEEDLSHTARQQAKRTGLRDGTGLSGSQLQEEEEEAGSFKEPLSYRRQRSRRAEKELHHISANLSHRLEELDQMLKRVLCESGDSSEVRDEDKHSHHSDSVMECRRTPRLHTVSGTADADSAQRTRSLSPSPPRPPHPQQGQLDGTATETPSSDPGRRRNLTASDRTRRGEPCRTASLRKHRKHLAEKVYEEQLKRYEERKQADLDKARLKAQEAEREYREAILRDVSQAARPPPAKTKAQHKSQRGTQTTAGRTRRETSRREPALTVKENDLLPVLLEELPHLHISPKVLGQLWERQMHQVDRLHAVTTSHRPRRTKLSSELEDAHRRHDLLVGIINKEQDHNRRLKDFRERIQQQKSSQNRLRDQRQQVARARKYYDDYHVQHRARLMRERTKEERMFRQLFEEGLEVQKVRLREQRDYAREQRVEQQRRHQDHIKSMENYYKDQFSLLAEKLAQERQEVQVRKKAQEKALLKMKRELRSRMEREIGELQRIIIQNDEDDYFQGLEVQRLRNRVRMASFQHNTSYLH